MDTGMGDILPPTFINLSDLDVPPTDRRISGLSALSVRPIVLHTQDKYGVWRPMQRCCGASLVRTAAANNSF